MAFTNLENSDICSGALVVHSLYTVYDSIARVFFNATSLSNCNTRYAAMGFWITSTIFPTAISDSQPKHRNRTLYATAQHLRYTIRHTLYYIFSSTPIDSCFMFHDMFHVPSPHIRHPTSGSHLQNVFYILQIATSLAIR